MEHFYPLDLADHTDWHSERNYSQQVRGALARVMLLLERSRHRKPAFARAYTLIRPLLDAPMSRHQRLRLSYYAALSRAARSEDRAALHWLDKTLDLESQLRDTADLATLHFLRGGIHRRMLRFAAASHDHRRALSILSGDIARAHYHSTDFHMEVLTQLVGFEFYRGHYDEAQRYLRQTDRLMPYVTRHSIPEATLWWMRSLLNRWAGRAKGALCDALAAIDVFREQGSATSAERIILHAVDCTLDIAERLDMHSSARHRTLTETHRDLRAARKLATWDGDEYGHVLVTLGEVRLSRLEGRNEDRQHTIEQMLFKAQALEDEILIAQSFTTLGDEFAAHDERDSANTCYRAAIDALDGSDSLAAGVWAWRGLHYPEENAV